MKRKFIILLGRQSVCIGISDEQMYEKMGRQNKFTFWC